MNLPPVSHLPGFTAAAESAWHRIGDTPLEVPELDAAAAERIWCRLEAAAAAWRGRDLRARVEALAGVLQALRARGPEPWREALARSAGLSPAGVDAAWEATFAPHDAALLHDALRLEMLDDVRLAGLERDGRLPRRLVHVLSGNVLPPTLAMLLRGWLLGAAQWLRPAAREPLFAACLLADLATLLPEIAACTAVCWWPHAGAATPGAVLGSAHAVTVQGSDDAVRAVRSRVQELRPGTVCVGYGSRWSAAIVSRPAQTPATAQALGSDVALFDQQGCLSPSLVFAQRGPGLADWCGELAAALAALEARMPRGQVRGPAHAALRHWHEEARLGRVLGRLDGFWEPERSTAWGVALLAGCEAYDTPLDRHVVVVPFGEIDEIVRAQGERLLKLQGLAVALESWPESTRSEALARLNATRAAPAGTLQSAPLAWRQDHRPPFGSLLLPEPSQPGGA